MLAQSVERVGCRAGGHRFDSQGRTNTQGLKITEKWSHSLCSASGETFAWLGWPRKMVVPSSVGDVKYRGSLGRILHCNRCHPLKIKVIFYSVFFTGWQFVERVGSPCWLAPTRCTNVKQLSRNHASNESVQCCHHSHEHREPICQGLCPGSA